MHQFREGFHRQVSVYLRLALFAGFFASVTDRLGLWSPSGTANVAWGNFQHFAAYTARLNPWAPSWLVPPIVWFVTVAEIALGLALLLGIFTRAAALCSGVLILLFGLGMTIGTGVKSALNASVFAASAAAFALATMADLPLSLDRAARIHRRTDPSPGAASFPGDMERPDESAGSSDR
jgi:uncharacterized membrane protein YphA (DoxX/SURF4 family)